MSENRKLWVNVYEVTRQYGGPEEGGWWYNQGELLERHRVLPGEDAEKTKKFFEEEYAYVNEGNIYSVLGGSLLQVSIEDMPGMDWPPQRPHYE